jgi:hypothetical protein
MPNEKTINESDTCEVFKFAEETYGIHWNDCCDLLHRTDVLHYGTTREYFSDWKDYIWSYKDPEYAKYPTAESIPMEVFNAMSDRDKGNVIMWRFFEHHNMSTCYIDCD